MNLWIVAGLVVVAIFVIGAMSLGPLGRALVGNDPFTIFEAGIGTVARTGQSVGNEIGSKLDQVGASDANEAKTKVTGVEDKVPVSTSIHLLSDTYVIAPGSEKIIRFTTASDSTPYLTGTAKVAGGGHVTLTIKDKAGECHSLYGCESKIVWAKDAVTLGASSSPENNKVSLRVFSGSENQLVLMPAGAKQQTITLDLSITYQGTEIKPASQEPAVESSQASTTVVQQPAETSVAPKTTNLDSTTIINSIQSSINQKRFSINYQKLNWNIVLARVAEVHSEYNSKTKTLTLYDAEKYSPTTRAANYGYVCNNMHDDGLNHLINEVNMKLDTKNGYETNEKVASYAASYLFDHGAQMKNNLEAGIGLTIDGNDIVWITFDGC